MKFRTLTAIALLGLATACGDASTAGGEAGGGAGAAAPARPAAIGQMIKVGDIEYTVTGVEAVGRVGNNPYLRKEASEGATFVVVRWSMKNAGTRPMEFYDKATMHLVDPAGVEFSSDDEATMTYGLEGDVNEKTFGDLNPGVTSRGADVYEVASASFDPATWTLKLEGADQRAALQ